MCTLATEEAFEAHVVPVPFTQLFADVRHRWCGSVQSHGCVLGATVHPRLTAQMSTKEPLFLRNPFASSGERKFALNTT